METSNEKSKKENEQQVKEQEKSDPGTTNTPDPQENMEGPVSSLMHIIGGGFEDKDAEKKIKEEKK
jgi:hypothetical protein